MLTLPSSVRVFLAIEPIDMRGSFDALAGHVRRMDLDPQDGHLYVLTHQRSRKTAGCGRVIRRASEVYTMSRRKLRNAEEARQCLLAVQNSGVTRVAWAHAHGIDARSLNAWRLVLQRGEKGSRPRRPPPPAPPDLRLVEWVPADDPTAPPPCFVVRCGRFAVELDAQFDEAALRRLLCVVASC